MSSLLAGQQSQPFTGPYGAYALLPAGSEFAQVGECLTGNAPRTVEWWSRVPASTQSISFFRSGVYGPQQGSFMCGYTGGPPGGCSYKFTGYNADFTVYVPHPPARPVHHAVTFDGHVLSFYVDLALVGSKAIGALNTLASPFVVGLGEGNAPGPVASMRVWERALTQAELVASASQYVPANSPGLWADWAMNEGSGPVASDRSPNGRDLVVPASTQWVSL